MDYLHCGPGSGESSCECTWLSAETDVSAPAWPQLCAQHHASWSLLQGNGTFFSFCCSQTNMLCSFGVLFEQISVRRFHSELKGKLCKSPGAIVIQWSTVLCGAMQSDILSFRPNVEVSVLNVKWKFSNETVQYSAVESVVIQQCDAIWQCSNMEYNATPLSMNDAKPTQSQVILYFFQYSPVNLY